MMTQKNIEFMEKTSTMTSDDIIKKWNDYNKYEREGLLFGRNHMEDKPALMVGYGLMSRTYELVDKLLGNKN